MNSRDQSHHNQLIREMTLPQLTQALVELLEKASSEDTDSFGDCLDILYTAKPLWTELQRRMQ